VELSTSVKSRVVFGGDCISTVAAKGSPFRSRMPRALPTGTVTFVFTDVEGSTALLHERGAAQYADALAAHRRAVRDAFTAEGGVEVDNQGDAFFFAFPAAQSAVAAAARANEALAGGPIRVRIGIHTGTPHVTDEGYVGEDVHLGARVAAAGHGGQVLLSKATHDVVDTEVRDLGEHRLKDFAEPVWIYQLGSEPFPPLRTISNTNLPRPASSFVGRGREVSEVSALLREVRLVTLTGPGGSGKTRLAIEAATELVPEFRNGVFWVGLAPLRDPALVLPTIAKTLGAKDGPAEWIGERDLMLLLDNLEQVIETAPELAGLVEACPNLKLLVTSRERLRVRGETEYPVPPLADLEAVELFAARSRVEADEATAELCRRLDSLPLAVELAAAQTSVLSPRQILERISERLDLLEGGRDADARQATLRATIAWSHDLLPRRDAVLFHRLAVFSGGCTVEAAEQIADADPTTLRSLVDKSLVRHTQERFWMLETIREFALEQLQASGEEPDLRRRHAEHFLALARAARSDLLRGVAQLEWHPRLDADLDNIRAVLDWTFDEDPAVAVELTAALGRYWWMRAPNEGMAWLERALAHPDLPPDVRAAALEAAGGTAWFLNEPERTGALVAQALGLYRELGDRVAVGRLLNMTGPPLSVAGREEEAERVLTEALALNEELGAEGEVALSLSLLGHVAYARGDVEKAVDLWERSVVLARRRGILWMLASNLHSLADTRFERGELDAARDLCREAIRRSRELGEESGTMVCLGLFSTIAALSGDDEKAGLLWGAVERLDEELGESYVRGDLERYREQLGDRGPEFGAARSRGRTLTLEEATAVALDSG
jgi:predicted ATPase/class 3 adenylate cyclase